jgi:hypothetical protein
MEIESLQGRNDERKPAVSTYHAEKLPGKIWRRRDRIAVPSVGRVGEKGSAAAHWSCRKHFNVSYLGSRTLQGRVETNSCRGSNNFIILASVTWPTLGETQSEGLRSEK